MNTILRKLTTVARLLASPKSLSGIVEASRKNVCRLNILCHAGRPFVYTRRDGMRFVCIPASPTSVHEYENKHIGYEEIELRICRQWLQPGDACFDIGANIGLMTHSFSMCVGSKGLVVSVEPAPNDFLFQAMQLLGLHNVHREPFCVADHEGLVPFMVATSAGSDVEASMKIDARKSDKFAQIMIPAVTIDSLIEKHGVMERLALVKVDIEGAEPMAFAGGARIFDRDRLPLFVAEVHKAQLANFGFTPLDVVGFFPIELFELFHVQRSTSDLTPRFEFGRLYPLLNPTTHDWPWYSNLVAVPRVGRYAHRRLAIAGLLP
jgi:FkbM family methyltransferase